MLEESTMIMKPLMRGSRSQTRPTCTVVSAPIDVSVEITLLPQAHMHNLYSRVNNGSAFLSSCVMVLLAAIAASSFVFTTQPKGSLSVKVNKV